MVLLVSFFGTVFATLFLTSKIHEYGHAIAIHYFRPELKVELKLVFQERNSLLSTVKN